MPVRYKSSATFLEIPVIAIAVGPDSSNNEVRGHARGVIAIGDMATGFVAIGGLARGAIALGGLAVGLVAFGGLGLGVLAFGGLALDILPRAARRSDTPRPVALRLATLRRGCGCYWKALLRSVAS